MVFSVCAYKGKIFGGNLEGNGLGLALVKRIVDLCGGKLGVSNIDGGGVCFTVELPYVITDMM